MRAVNIDEKAIYGLSTRTTNANEMNPKTAKLGTLWQKFDKEVAVDYQNGERVYGVYYDYESDADGEFSVLAGYEKSGKNLEEITLLGGKYLLFHSCAKTADENARIQAVIETWGKVWEYFSDENSEFKRVYKTDFEYYKNAQDIEIFISIK